MSYLAMVDATASAPHSPAAGGCGMKTNLVRLEYQGIAVSFNEDGWFNATAVAVLRRIG